MKVSIELSSKKIADLMVTVIEGNNMVAAWCTGIHLLSENPDNTEIWYANPKVYDKSFTIEVDELLDESKEPKGDNIASHVVGSADFAKGLALMLEKSPDHFGDFICENYDIVTADVFLQYVVFGEVKYA